LIATGAIAWEAIQRFFEPGEVAGLTVMIVAGFGILANGLAAWCLMAGQKGDTNIRGAFLHMVADASVSLSVVVAGGLIILTGWNWLDPTMSIIISAVIVWGTWSLLREAVNQSLSAVPAGIDPKEVARYLSSQSDVDAIHDLHIWAMSTTETALTCHLVMPKGHPGDEFIANLSQQLNEKFKIVHPTLQIELADAGVCKLAPEQVV
jgi:cobalt-zinc-cadmium efflux system protein